MGYLPVTELKTCRLVCFSWECEAHKFLKVSTLVVFNSISRIKVYIRPLPSTITCRLRFACNFKFGPELDLSRQEVYLFLSEYGPYIKSIHFDKTRWTANELRRILCEFLTHLEELTLDPDSSLNLEDFRLFPVPESYTSRQLSNRIPVLSKLKYLKLNWELNHVGSPLLKELTLMIPNLEKLTAMKPTKRNRFELSLEEMIQSGRHFIERGAESMPEAVVEDLPFLNCHIILSQLVVSNTGPPFHRLKDLDIHVIGSDSAVKKLEAKNLPLERLDLSPTPNVAAKTLYSLFISLKNTLTHLKLKFHPHVDFCESVPASRELKKLTFLSLVGYKGSLQILEDLPQLKTLILTRVNLSETMVKNGFHLIDRLSLEQPHGLQTLEVHHDPRNRRNIRPYEDYVLQKLVHICPNLKKLRLESMNDSNLRLICSSLPDLEVLLVVEGNFTDSGVTGIPSDFFSDINNLDSFNYPRLPYIGSLKHLRRLELESPFLTDSSVLYGVVDCKSLRGLTLTSHGITDVSVRKVVEDMTLSCFKTEFCSQITKPAKMYAEKVMKGHDISINDYHGPMEKVDIVKFLKRNRPLVVLRKVDILIL